MLTVSEKTMCCMSYMGYLFPWIQCDSMGMIYFYSIIVPVVWAKFYYYDILSCRKFVMTIKKMLLSHFSYSLLQIHSSAP